MRTCLRRFQYISSRNCVVPRSSRSINDDSILLSTKLGSPVSVAQETQSAAGSAERKRLDLSFLRDDLRRWSDAGDVDMADQYRGYEQKRQAFTSAIKTLQAMTTKHINIVPDSDVKTRGLYDTVYNGTINEASSCAFPQFEDVNPESYTGVSFLKYIHDLTRKRPANSVVISAELRAMFESAGNRALLSTHAYTLAVSYCLRISDYKLLRFFMYHSQENNIAATSWLCHTVLAVFVHENNLTSWAMALQMFADVGVRADIDTWNQLLTLGDRPQKEYVLRKLLSAGLRPNTVTQGILLPLHRTYYDDMGQFIASLKKVRWTEKLGDVLIGELLRTKDLNTILTLLSEPSFLLSIEGIDQILAHILAISAKNFNHQKIVRKICRCVELRGLQLSQRTFLLLYRMGAKIKRPRYSDMIYSKAVSSGNLSRELKYRRVRDRQRYPRQAGTHDTDNGLDWHTWLHAV